MASGKLAAVILVSMLVVMASVEVSEARNCFNDCMGSACQLSTRLGRSVRASATRRASRSVSLASPGTTTRGGSLITYCSHFA
ncbi:hypothetical protein QJS10_CPA06g00995 [Acorus calamus]|uniref:Uncharacterized protein n=1 Tax=Acorus calamus TaxID=4465 RepID=A0AAV9EJQ7_ACOCL|nr:hypothetical protein QJS10_CPA06g00995 [Acorus calamus]